VQIRGREIWFAGVCILVCLFAAAAATRGM